MARFAVLVLTPLALLGGCASRVYAPAPVSFNRPSQLQVRDATSGQIGTVELAL